MSIDRFRSGQDVLLFIALYALECSAVVLAMSLHRKGDLPVRAFFGTRAGLLFVAALLILAASGGVVLRCYRVLSRAASRLFIVTVAVNAASVVLVLATAELALRAFSTRVPTGVVFAGVPLLPRSWNSVVSRNRGLLDRASSQGSFLVSDPMLGWTIGRNARSADGLYFSSTEGIRSPRSNVVFGRERDRRPLITLVGDSHTFGLEVPLEDSWGDHLEREFHGAFQVLNFGVDGYGVDQSYLRYLRDVRPWRPDVVIFGISNHDFVRSMAVYAFVSFPHWELPFAKPRFELRQNQLELLNVPLIPPDSIVATSSIASLPFIEYDQGYVPDEWRWRRQHTFYLARVLGSIYRPRVAARAAVGDDARTTVNVALLRSFVEKAAAEGSVPLVTYLPNVDDLRAISSEPSWTSDGQRILKRGDIGYINLVPCVLGVEESHRFVVRHYSAQVNMVIPRCMRDAIVRALSGRMLGAGRSHLASPAGEVRRNGDGVDQVRDTTGQSR